MAHFKSKEDALVACEAARIRFVADCEAKKQKKDEPDYADEKLYKSFFDLDAEVDGSIAASFTVRREHCNHEGLLHGGVAVALVASLNCWNTLMFARYSKSEGRWDIASFASRSISASYLRPAHLGLTVRIISRPVVFNKTMVYLEGYIKSLDGSCVYTAVQHHVFGVAILEPRIQNKRTVLERSLKQAEEMLEVKAKL